MNQLKRYEDLPFQKKLFFVFGFSLVFCIVVAVFVLTDYCTRILVRNNIDNLTVISQQAGIDFNRRVSDTEKQLFNNITMFQIPDSIAACDADKSDYKKRELKYRLNQIVAAVLTVVTLICGCILMQYLTRKVSRQINALSDTIQNAAKGEIGIQAPVYMNDDIGKIARRFNEMSLQNKKLIEELVQAEAQKNSAKMEAVDYKYRFLHTQINPHFIYNSLETINAIAKVNHTPEVSRIVQLIGKYFRNITKYSDHQFIALEKEFELLQCFIDIYKNIRGSNIEIRLDYPQELKSVEIPTMLLQPIVENSFVHGMRGMDELFIVCLSAKGIRDEQGKLSEMILSVEDNGIGMDEEAVERLTKGKRTEPDEKDRKKVFRNIGVPNIIERLKMLYGDRAKLTVTSGENGTTIQIRLPADGEKKEII